MSFSSACDHHLSLADLAQQCSIAEPTCRYYCKRFAEYIPSVGKGRRRRFSKGALKVIAFIDETIKTSHSPSAVDEALAERFSRSQSLPAVKHRGEITGSRFGHQPVHDLDQAFPPIALAFMERQTLALEGIAKMLNLLTTHLCSTSVLSGMRQNSSITELQRQVSRLSILLDSNEKTQEADIDQLRRWLAHFMRKRGRSA